MDVHGGDLYDTGRKRGGPYVAAIIGLVVVATLASTNSDEPVSATTTTTPVSAEWVDQYGGSPEVFERIVNGFDCTALQAEFERAWQDNQHADPGTHRRDVTAGYMIAADERMESIGCY